MREFEALCARTGYSQFPVLEQEGGSSRLAGPVRAGGTMLVTRGERHRAPTKEKAMLWTIAAVLLGLWLLGLVLDLIGAVIHIVLVVALVVLAVKLFQDFRSRSRA